MPILGTSPDAIDLAEDRNRFKHLLDKLKLKQPKNGIAYSVEQARAVAADSRLSDRGAPLLCARRPRHADHPRRRSARRSICSDLARAGAARRQGAVPNDKTGRDQHSAGPLLFDRYLSDATEVDVDCLADGNDTFIAGIMEHIEEAGIHSGDFGLLAAAAYSQARSDRGAGPADAGACAARSRSAG